MVLPGLAEPSPNIRFTAPTASLSEDSDVWCITMWSECSGRQPWRRITPATYGTAAFTAIAVAAIESTVMIAPPSGPPVAFAMHIGA